MDVLPSEIIEQIILILEDELQTLRAFSLASSRVYQLTAPILYRTAIIRFSGFSELQKIVAEYAESGLGRPFLTHATRLDLVALPKQVRRLGGGSGLHRFNTRDRSVTIEDFQPHGVGSFMERLMSQFDLPGYGRRRGGLPGAFSKNEWQPLVSLVSRLAKLKNMHYAIRNSFPRSLLDAVHQHHPTCGIYIWSPQTPRLDIPGVGPIENTMKLGGSLVNDLLDMEVLRSPCLRAISLDYPIFAGYPKTLHLGRIVPYIIQAPDIKHIHLNLDGEWGDEFRKTIQSIPQHTGDTSPLAGLHSLSLQSYLLEDLALSQWTPVMDLSALKSLHIPMLGFFHSPSHLNDAVPGLVSLERLWIGADPGHNGWTTFSEELRSIFQRLRPLKYLCIEGLEHISFLHDILERHGSSLVGFMLPPGRRRASIPEHPQYAGYIYPFVDDTHLQKIAQRCPNLKYFRVPIRRSKGDHAEVRTYRALGSFPSLQNLILDLYGNSRPVLSAEQGIFSNENAGGSDIPHVSLEDALVNFATDQALATAIWTEIASHQPSQKLTRLRVSPWGYAMYDIEEQYVLMHLARSFLVTRGTHGETDVVEIGKEENEADMEVIAAPDEYGQAQPFRVPRRVTRLLHSIWRPTPSHPDWTTSWKSLPLHTDMD
ncbi:hypothetical protein N8T08_003789 [Aspergillus melleus]|uniref:Uncharacterized protein n=1 Tax=Aspergillus melleus TaxID=138277 RepID=A0ACC3B5S2_9EURO|nr:hypothetical protein N8T08_003789 [Aspergillus melleus]